MKKMGSVLELAVVVGRRRKLETMGQQKRGDTRVVGNYAGLAYGSCS